MSNKCNPDQCQCGNSDSPPQEKDISQRREFLKFGFASFAAMAGAVGIGGINVSAKEPNPQEKGASCGNSLPVLSSDGKLIDPITGKEVEKDPHFHSHDGSKAVREGIPNRKWVMVIDLAECDGCEKCTSSCSKAHNTPPERQWIRVFKMKGTPETKPYWFPKPCFHCDDPPCTRVCPVDATFKRQDGIVLIDSDRCIGCRFCMAACPYSTRYFNWGPVKNPTEVGYTPEKSNPRKMGTVEKCDFCPDMLRQGKLPHCASACTMGAIMFGDANEDAVTDSKGRTHRLSKLLAEKGGYRYLEELGTKPSVYYLPAKNPTYDPPKPEDSELIEVSMNLNLKKEDSHA